LEKQGRNSGESIGRSPQKPQFLQKKRNTTWIKERQRNNKREKKAEWNGWGYRGDAWRDSAGKTVRLQAGPKRKKIVEKEARKGGNALARGESRREEVFEKKKNQLRKACGLGEGSRGNGATASKSVIHKKNVWKVLSRRVQG